VVIILIAVLNCSYFILTAAVAELQHKKEAPTVEMLITHRQS
jgi:hypothetical protein